MLPKRREAKYLQFFFISRLPKIIVKKNSEDPGDDDEELGEEHDQEDTENGNNV